MVRRRAYADPTADKALGRLERWLKEKKARQALERRTSHVHYPNKEK